MQHMTAQKLPINSDAHRPGGAPGQWLADDVPYGDLTTDALGIGDQAARMRFEARRDAAQRRPMPSIASAFCGRKHDCLEGHSRGIGAEFRAQGLRDRVNHPVRLAAAARPDGPMPVS